MKQRVSGREQNRADETPQEVTSESVVSLREITADTLHSILDLRIGPGQEKFVAPNDLSIAQAHFAPDAWFRAIYADETPVGFLLMSEQPEKPQYYL